MTLQPDIQTYASFILCSQAFGRNAINIYAYFFHSLDLMPSFSSFTLSYMIVSTPQYSHWTGQGIHFVIYCLLKLLMIEIGPPTKCYPSPRTYFFGLRSLRIFHSPHTLIVQGLWVCIKSSSLRRTSFIILNGPQGANVHERNLSMNLLCKDYCYARGIHTIHNMRNIACYVFLSHNCECAFEQP